MARTFRDSLTYDATNVFLNTNEFADSLTLTSAGNVPFSATVSARLTLLGLPPVPDGVISIYDRLNLLGLTTLAEWVEAGASSVTITGIVEFDIEDEGQGYGVEDGFGRRVQRMGRVHVAADLPLIVDDSSENCDWLTISGDRWSCIRIEGRDNSMKTIVIRHDDKITTRQGRKRA